MIVTHTISQKKVVTPLQQHQNFALTWLELDTQAFEHNVRQYKTIIGPHVNLALIVKSNAYGHGLHEIGQLAQKSDSVDWLCSATLTDAVLLRKQGITKPLLILGLLDDDPQLLIEHDLDTVVFDFATLTLLNAIGVQHGKTINVHLKIDTGLSRFGFFPEQLLEMIDPLCALRGITLRGICTHFAESDNAQQEFTLQQFDRFNSLIVELTARGVVIPLAHSDNTAATTTVEGSHGTLVRIGAGAYGLRPSQFAHEKAQHIHQQFENIPVLTWKTKILTIRALPAGSYVGYSKTFKTARPTTIAIIPIGYYDGYDRRLSNKGTVVIRTQNSPGTIFYAPVIGRVCMNVTIIDITDVAHAREGDEVILLGNYPGLRAHEIATTIESFNPREITSRLSPTINRYLLSN